MPAISAATTTPMSGVPLSIEHIILRVTDGSTKREILCRSCRPCNEQKGGQLSAADYETGELRLLYTRVHSLGGRREFERCSAGSC